MTTLMILSVLTPADLGALALCLVLWAGVGWIIEHPPARRPSVTVLMGDMRRAWMAEFARRESRIFDATLIGNLRQGTAYFASTAILALGALLALIGNTAPLEGLAEGLIAAEAPAIIWQVRLLLPVLFLAHAFLKFVWSHRLFAYCAVLMAAVPNDVNDPQAYPRAAQAADINITAARNFNKGLRAIYFALAALGWLLGPWGLILAALAATTVLMRREFMSQSRDVMLRR